MDKKLTTMEKSHIFFDFDGMKFDTLPAQITYVNSRYGINSIAPDYLGNNNNLDLIVKKYLPDIKISRDEMYKDFGKNFISSFEIHEHVSPMKDMPGVISKLSKKYLLTVVTARQQQGLPVIKYLIEKHVYGCIHDIHCVWGHSEKNGFIGISKRDFIASVSGNKLGFFDDSLHEIEEVKDLVPSYLFDPLGLHTSVKDINLVRSWKEIGEMYL